jgi:WD40 repeat protein
MALSPDGTRLATASDRTAQVWDVATRQELAQFVHKEFISQMVFSPDGQTLVTSSDDRMVRLWNIATGKEYKRFLHNAQVYFVTFVSEHGHLLTRSRERSVRVWSTATGEELFQLAHTGTIEQIAYSTHSNSVATANQAVARVWDVHTGQKIAQLPLEAKIDLLVLGGNGKQLATVISEGGFASKVLQMWDVATQQERFRLTHDEPINTAAFSADSALIATGSHDRSARVWNAFTGEELTRLAHDAPVSRVVLSPNKAYLAATTRQNSGDMVVHVWDLAAKRQLALLPHDSSVDEMVFNAANRLLATADGQTTVRLWDPSSAQPELVRILPGEWPRRVALSPDGQLVAAAIYDSNTARLWDVTTGKAFLALLHPKRVDAMAFSPDGAHLVTSSADMIVRLWEVATGRELLQFNHESAVYGIAFSLDGSLIATRTAAGTVHLWEVTSGKERQVARDGFTNTLAFSPDGRFLVTAEGRREMTRDKENMFQESHVGLLAARQWDVATGQEMARFLHSYLVDRVLFSPDGALVATDMSLSRTDAVHLWEVTTGKLVARLVASPDGDPIDARAFSPGGKYLATTIDKEVWIWNVATQQESIRLRHNDTVSDVVFSADGQYMAVENGSQVSVWVWQKGQELVRLQHEDSVTSVAFTPDDTRIVTASQDDTLRVWAWRSTDLVADACMRVERNLTREEWQTFLGRQPYRPTCPDWPTPQE